MPAFSNVSPFLGAPIAPIAALASAMRFLLEWSYALTASYGLSIIFLSLVVNICLLPAYHLAERWQNRERLLQRSFQAKLDEFKRAFSGAYLHAVIRTYYRQQKYHPVLALRAGLGLFLQIPFFLAAYRLLSHYSDFGGQSFSFLKDLNQPDSLLFILGERINVLPFVMTACNLLAAAVYGRKLLAKEKRQIYVLSLLFFILLYHSPAGWLLYWTCNNIFSLVKNSIQVCAQRYGTKEGRTSRDFPGIRIRLGHGWRYLREQAPSLAIWGIRILQVVGLLLFIERMIFFKEEDAAIPEAVLSLYLAAVYILAVHLLQLGLNGWRLHVWPPSRYGYLWHLIPSVLLPSVLLPLLWLSWQGTSYGANAMYDRLGWVALALLALCFSFAAELGSARLPERNRYAALRPWAVYFSGSPLQEGQRKLEWPLYGNIFCTHLLILVAVPLTFAASSPSEFPQIFTDLYSRLLPGLAALTLVLCLGAFVVRMSSQAMYRIIQVGSFSVLTLAVVNVFLLPGDYGTLSNFVWDQPQRFRISELQRLRDAGLLIALSALPIVLWRKRQFTFLRCLSATLLGGTLLFSVYHAVFLNRNLQEPSAIAPLPSPAEPLLRFSRAGHNVAVLMLDRFIGGFVPELMRSFPQLAEEFRDFTWYANTVALGPTTVSSLPSILGGYDYSLFEINERLAQGQSANLAQELNRAYLVLPTIFEQQGYRSIVLNPAHANLATRGDLRVFEGTGIEALDLGGAYSSRWLGERGMTLADLGESANAMLPMLGWFRALPPSLRPSLYDEGVWLGANTSANGQYRRLLDEWSALYYLPQQTMADDRAEPLYFFYNNLVSHEPDFMGRNLEPSLEPISEMTGDERQRFRSLAATRHFYADGGALQLIGGFLRRLRALGVYDNTTIVILSDHSRDIYDPTMADVYGDKPYSENLHLGYLHPLLLVKRAGQVQDHWAEDRQNFMSVADLGALLQNELGWPMHDPFSTKDIGWERSRKEKMNGLRMAYDTPWNITVIQRPVEIPHAFEVKDNIFELANWKQLW
ncbi:MAG: YidC/Oxa1 family membrane protein insertase [Spirochaetota bacterium]